MKPPIIIGEKEFKYKKDAITYYKNILNSYKYGESLNKHDYNDVYNLLQQHQRAKEKIGVGVKEIKVDRIRNKLKCFRIVRVDSSTTGLMCHV